MTLNVGWSKKIGQPDYGSLGASVNLGVEIEGDAIRHPDDLREKIKFVFRQARDAVEQELATQHGGGHAGNGTNGHSRNGYGGNGASSNWSGSNGNSNGHRNDNGRKATQSQCKAIFAIAKRMHVDLPGLLQPRFGVTRPEDLGIAEASGVIDELKVEQNGEGERR